MPVKARNEDKGKIKDRPDAEVTCYYCSVGHRKADCWQAATSEAARQAHEGCEEGSAFGPPSACASKSWILLVEVADIDVVWTTHKEDWVVVHSGAGASACPVDHAPECEVKPGSVGLPLVGAGGDRMEDTAQNTDGYATREGADVEIAFEAAKVRQPLLSVDSWW